MRSAPASRTKAWRVSLPHGPRSTVSTPSRQRGALVHQVDAMVAGLHLGQSCHCRPGEARPRKSVKGLLNHANWRAGQQGASWANHGVSGGRTGLDWRVDAATIIRERKKCHGRRPWALVPHPAFCYIGENRRPAAHTYAQLLAWWWYYATLSGRTSEQNSGRRGSLPHSKARGRRRESPSGLSSPIRIASGF